MRNALANSSALNPSASLSEWKAFTDTPERMAAITSALDGKGPTGGSSSQASDGSARVEGWRR